MDKSKIVFHIYRDWKALRFVRCTTTLPDGSYAGGAAFSLATAMAKCESEFVERSYIREVLLPRGLKPIGIGAHPSSHAKARAHAEFEAQEHLCLIHIRDSGRLCGFPVVHLENFVWWVLPTTCGYFSMIVADRSGTPFSVYAAGRSLFPVLVKTWEEFRNVRFFSPSSDVLTTYTKANRMFGKEGLLELKFMLSVSQRFRVNLQAHEVVSDFYCGHHICFVTS